MEKNKIQKIFLIIASAVVGMGFIFALGIFIVAFAFFKTEFKIVGSIKGGEGGSSARVLSYESSGTITEWLFDNKLSFLHIFDMKNSSQSFDFLIRGVAVYNNTWMQTNKYFIYGGERYSVIRIPKSDGKSDLLYILHRIPKALGDESVEILEIPGFAIDVSPDESGFFYHPNGDYAKIAKADWGGNKLSEADLPNNLERTSRDFIFMRDGEALVIQYYDKEEFDHPLFIWDIVNNTNEIISIKESYPEYQYGGLRVEGKHENYRYINTEIYLNRKTGEGRIKEIKIYE